MKLTRPQIKALIQVIEDSGIGWDDYDDNVGYLCHHLEEVLQDEYNWENVKIVKSEDGELGIIVKVDVTLKYPIQVKFSKDIGNHRYYSFNAKGHCEFSDRGFIEPRYDIVWEDDGLPLNDQLRKLLKIKNNA
jgi:hypothetical protein